VVLQLSAHNPECIIDEVMIDVDLGEAVAGAGRNPLFIEIIIYHDTRAGSSYTLLRPLVTHIERRLENWTN